MDKTDFDLVVNELDLVESGRAWLGRDLGQREVVCVRLDLSKRIFGEDEMGWLYAKCKERVAVACCLGTDGKDAFSMGQSCHDNERPNLFFVIRRDFFAPEGFSRLRDSFGGKLTVPEPQRPASARP
jgi:hypothetical protein